MGERSKIRMWWPRRLRTMPVIRPAREPPTYETIRFLFEKSERRVGYDYYVFRLGWHFACYDLNLLVSVDVEGFEQGDLSVIIFLQIYIFLYLKISFGGRGIYNVENVYVTEGWHHVISARRRGADLPPFTSRDLKHLLFSKSRLVKFLTAVLRQGISPALNGF